LTRSPHNTYPMDMSRLSDTTMSPVALADCPDYDPARVRKSLRKLLDCLGGIDRWVRPGSSVFVKPNMLTAKRPERAITTHPAVVEAVVEEAHRAGGKVTLGDSPAGVLSSIERYWNETGYSDVARRTGAELAKLEGGRVVRRVVGGRDYHIAAAIAEADVVISVPKLKTHSLTVLTAGVKNTFGAIPGFRKAELHKLAPKPAPFSEVVVDVYEAVRPALTILDAVVALEGDGPSTKGSPRRVGLLMASPDAVALDAAAGALVGLGEQDVPTTAAAMRRGLGKGLAGAELLGEKLEDRAVRDFRRASSSVVRFVPTWAVWMLGRHIWVRPRVIEERCTGCALCADTCPVGAISIRADGISTIDYSKCIECLACLESCPEESIEQKVSWLARKVT